MKRWKNSWMPVAATSMTIAMTMGLMIGLSTSASASSNPYANVNLTVSVNGFGPQADNLNPFLPTSTDNSAYANTTINLSSTTKNYRCKRATS